MQYSTVPSRQNVWPMLSFHNSYMSQWLCSNFIFTFLVCNKLYITYGLCSSLPLLLGCITITIQFNNECGHGGRYVISGIARAMKCPFQDLVPFRDRLNVGGGKQYGRKAGTDFVSEMISLLLCWLDGHWRKLCYACMFAFWRYSMGLNTTRGYRPGCVTTHCHDEGPSNLTWKEQDWRFAACTDAVMWLLQRCTVPTNYSIVTQYEGCITECILVGWQSYTQFTIPFPPRAEVDWLVRLVHNHWWTALLECHI